MKKNEPYLKKNRFFTEYYKGGGYNPEVLKLHPRKPIKKLTRKSQKNLLMSIDTFKHFKANWYIIVFCPPEINIKDSIRLLKKFTRSLSSENYYTKKSIPPLFFWKKNYTAENKLTFEIITNIKRIWLTPTLMKLTVKYLWEKTCNYTCITNVIPVRNEDQKIAMLKFCLKFYSAAGDKETGRWWGIINRKYYTKRSLKKTHIKSNLKQDIPKDKAVHTNQIKGNIFFNEKHQKK